MMSQSPWGLALKPNVQQPESSKSDSGETERSIVHLEKIPKEKEPFPEPPYIPLKQNDPENRYHNERRGLIGLHGKWYDVTDFVSVHPGGDVIRAFLGKDATSVFTSIHHRNVLGDREPVGWYEYDKDDRFLRLLQWMRQRHYFTVDYFWTARMILFAFSLLIIAILIIVSDLDPGWKISAAIPLALFWQQCTYLMHDSMHNQITRSSSYDRLLGVFFGTVCCGLNADWWKLNHNLHHAMPNSFSSKINYKDPQMVENPPEVSKDEKCSQSRLRSIVVSSVFRCVLLRPFVLIYAILQEKKRLEEWFAFLLHIAWVCYLFSFLGIAEYWVESCLLAFFANTLHTVFCFPILLNHSGKCCHDLKTVADTQNWYEVQINTTRNLASSSKFDWFFGGFNFHVEHHLFPCMPRRNLRKASWHVKGLCEELSLDYEEASVLKLMLKGTKMYNSGYVRVV